MSDQSSAYSQSEQGHNERLSHIWKSIRQTKNISRQKIRPEHKHKDHSHDSRATRNQPSLYASSYHLHPQKHNSLQNVTILIQKLQMAEEQNLRLQKQLANIQNLAQQKIEALRKHYQKRLKTNVLRQPLQKQNIYENNMESNARVGQLTKQIERMTLRLKSLQLQNRSGQTQILKLTQINQQLVANLQNQQKSMNNKMLMNDGKGSQLLQLAQANNTIERLLELLKKTDKFRQFSAMVSQSKEMHYMKNILKRLKTNQLNISKKSKQCQCNSEAVLSQASLWSPVECYKIMLSMKLKYDYLNEDCIEEVLFQMNKIYNSKEEKHVGRVKSFYQGEIVKLKKKMEENYDQVTCKKQISRLKRQIKQCKSGQKVRPQAKMEGLKNKGQYEDELKLKVKQIKLLQQRIRLFQTENGYYDKSLYYQGAIWVVDKVLSELQFNQTTLKQFQIGFRERIQENVDAQDWLRSYKQFFQRITQVGSEMVERVLTIKRSMLKKMGNQKV